MNRPSAIRLKNLERLKNLTDPSAPALAFRVLRNDAATEPTRVDVYDDIGGGGWFSYGISAQDFVDQLAGIDGDLEVHINSSGGDVFDGIAMFNALASRKGKVTTVVDGLAASIASILAQAGHERVIAPGAMLMIHDVWSMCVGNAGDMREYADLLDQLSDNLATIYATRGGTPDSWRDAMRAETWYTAQESVDAGLADKLAQRPASAEDVAAHNLEVFAKVPDWLRARSSLIAAARTPQLPVAAGALGTQRPAAKRVLGAESMPLVNGPMPVHHTATVDESWDGPAAVKAMPNDDKVLRYCHAWQSDEAEKTPHEEGDDDADDQKSNYKFPHHKTDGGPANVAACRNGLARLSGADIPDGDRAGVRAHLQAHLDDANKKDGDQSEDHAHIDFSAGHAEQVNGAFTALKEALK